MGQYVTLYWEETRGLARPPEGGDRSGVPFRAYRPHPVAGWMPELTRATWRRVRDAEEAVRSLGAAGERLPAVEWLLARSESSASSTIEGIRSSAWRIAQASVGLTERGESPSGADAAALRNVEATRQALALGASGRPLTAADVDAVHATLMGGDDDAGVWRDRQNWIATPLDHTPARATYVPPPPEFVPDLMADLVVAINEPAAHPLVQAAMVHVQFINIHPYGDGNGRTGRALIQLVLRRAGLIETCVPPISTALAGRRGRYFAALNRTRPECAPTDPRRSQAVVSWVNLLSGASIDAVAYARNAIEHLREVRATWRSGLRAAGVRADSTALRLLDVLPEHPILSAATIASHLGVDARTARRAIERLVAAGALRRRGTGQRNRVFESPDILNAFGRLAEPDIDADTIISPPPPPDRSPSTAT